MRSHDFSSLRRSAIGFDLDLAEMASEAGEDNYPPYNIERMTTVTRFRWPWRASRLRTSRSRRSVTIEGSKPEKGERQFLHRSISTRNFKRQFSLADYVQKLEAKAASRMLRVGCISD
ncbi:heat-shock protein [Bradyrhizobium sp. CCBAU 53421]|uniref:heat-shock protein n=1 Tax=Bradyrhizobium sp. CCBAU 53421 TaxID=1325120 RepID=UPI00188C1735